MSKPNPTPNYSTGRDDTFWHFLDSASKTAFWAGLGAIVVGLGFLIYTFSVAGTGGPVTPGQVEANAELFGKVLMGGVIAFMLAITFIAWGEETLGVLQLVGSAALYFAPLYLPGAFGNQNPSPGGQAALGAIQSAGTIGGAIAIIVLIADVAVRVRVRSKQGMRSDALKYGKGIKEESEIQNVFMGKCWQLPFCRKFVRERCPIYHSRRACWREQVGCMCEEQVIRDAMEGKVIPKDMVGAAQFIPRNNRLTTAQKHERCRQCVIYNEHQKHKYKLFLPLVTLFFGVAYLLFRAPLLAATGGIIEALDRIIGRATFRGTAGVGQTISESGLPFKEILLVCFMIVLFAYALKLLEYLIFKLKV